jgi:hypothetical protein
MLIRSDKLWDLWMRGAGWLWLSRAFNAAGAVSFALFAWKFLSGSLLQWLTFFFVSLTAFFVAAKVKRRSVAAPPAAGLSGRGAGALGASGAAEAAALPPRAMFDREGRTPLERVFTQDEEAGLGAGARRRGGE